MLKIAVWSSVALLSIMAYGDNGLTAVLQGNGTVYVNGQRVLFGSEGQVGGGIRSTAVTSGDIIETKEDGATLLNAVRLTATTGANTILRVQSAGVALDRGTITLGTGNASSVFARDFKVTPVSTSWTQFNVVRSTGLIQILALQGDVAVSCGTGKPITVKEGHQLSRADAANCGLAATRDAGAPPAALGPIISSSTAQKAALAVGGSLAGWAVFQADDPASPSIP